MGQRLWTFLRNIFRKEQADRELDEEIRSYLELTAAEKIQNGMSREEAMREARRELGGAEQVKESVRDVRSGAGLDALIQDARYAFRTLRKNLSFTIVMVLTLALGIGANTTIFTVVNSVLLKPLPYPDPDKLVMLWETQLHDAGLGTVAPANFYDWREQSRSFERMAAIDAYPDFILSGPDGARRLTGAQVSADFFALLGVRMALGRGFLAEEDRRGESNVVVLSHGTWAEYFGGREDIVGKSVKMNDTDYKVIGVLPRDFSLVSRASDFQFRNHFEVWTPLALASPPEPWQRGTHPLCVYGRLKSGVTLPQAQADLDGIANNLQKLYPASDKDRGIRAVPLAEHTVANVQTALLTVSAAVGMVLLLACANLANLLFTRAISRQKEIALRITLGASRKRIAQQLLTESSLLVAIGGLAGLLLAYLSVPAIVRYLPPDLPRSSEIAVDGRVLAFTALIAVATSVVFGLLPLAAARGPEITAASKHGGRTIAAGESRLRGALIVSQVAIALVLLAGGGLMAKSFWTLLQVPPGFQTEHILTARLSLPPQYLNDYKFGTGAHREISAFQRKLLEKVKHIPGVESAAFTAYLPLAGTDNSWAFEIEGRPAKAPGEYDIMYYRPVSAGYFGTMRIAMQRGRDFRADDDEDHPLAVIINETMARKFWKGEDPIGQRLRFDEPKWRTIVGVVRDVHHKGLSVQPSAEMYLPYAQVPNVEARPTIVVRTAMEPTRLTGALREAVSEVDRNVPLDQVATMKQVASASIAESRFRTTALLIFSALALFVASTGLYGVMSYLVGQRTQEFGIRMAVGASSSNVLRMVLRRAVKLVGIGIVLGLIGTALLTRFIATLLYETSPLDAATLAGVSIVLGVVVLLASYVPARRAANVDPMVCLRYE